MANKFIATLGNRGLIGKSTIATLIASYFDAKGEKFIIIDTDVENANVSSRFSESENAEIIVIPMSDTKTSSEEMITEMFDEAMVVYSEGANIILNVPAESNKDLMVVEEMLCEAFQEEGFETIMTYMMTNDEGEFSIAETFFSSDFVKSFDHRFLINNRVHTFPDTRKSKVLKDIPIIELPENSVLSSAKRNIPRDMNFNEVIESGILKGMKKNLFKKWLNRFYSENELIQAINE